MIEAQEDIRARIDAEWLAEGQAIVARERSLERTRDSLAWELGDWIAGRETAYGDMTRLAAELEMPLGTLKNRASVARRIRPSRRRDDLSFSHHAEVAGLDPEAADATLAEAALYSWSVERLRSVLHERGAKRKAEREVERLQAEVAALRAAATAPDEAKRVVNSVRAEIEAGIDLIEEGYRRILAATRREDLGIAAAALHGNARRRLVPSLEALIGRAVERAEPAIQGIEAALTELSAVGSAPASNRHDDGTFAAGDPGGMEAPPAAVAGDTS